MTRIQFDESRWPVVVVNYPKRLAMDDWTTHLDRLGSYPQRRTPYATICLTNGSVANSAQRKAAAELMKKNKVTFNRYCVANAIVMESALQRGALTAISWISGGPPFPQKVFATQKEAELWAKDKLSRAA